MTRADRYRSWARPAPDRAARAQAMYWRDEPWPRVNGTSRGTFLPFGNGRSYGDSCLSPAGTLLDMRGLDRFIAFDAMRGILRCESGVLLSEILDFAVPRGWFPPVTPGTRFVTVGGAIANDVHGKNHHRAGSFGHHLRCFELLRSDGSRRICSPVENADWFAATVGGLGLTGVILWAEIALKPVAGAAMSVETLRFSRLDEFFDISRESSDRYEYTVAWIDCLKPGGPRGLFLRANHDESDGPPPAAPRRKPGVPFTPPFLLLPRPLVSLFNAFNYRRPRAFRSRQHYETFFYPLDSIPNWNRLFGRKGFYQYQCVVPPAAGRDAVAALIADVTRAGEGSFMSVLKVFGDHAPRGWLSFSRPGVTLALDLPDRGPGTLALLKRLDAITREADGAVYPAKDARMSAETFRRGFPRWRELETYRDPACMSGLWARVAGGEQADIGFRDAL